MSNLNVFIDGSWLFKACQRDGVFSKKTISPEYNFKLDFNKLVTLIGKHVRSQTDSKIRKGDLYVATSIFGIPSNFTEWVHDYPDKVTQENVDKILANNNARENFFNNAMEAGFSDQAVFRPEIKPHIVRQLADNKYQEKQVDSTVVALLVKYAITRPSDFHVIVSGDADMIPAITTVCPEFTSNATFATSHPDQFNRKSISSLKISELDLKIKPLYLDMHVEKFMYGEFCYKCSHCNLAFFSRGEISGTKLPYCKNCFSSRPGF